MAGIASMDFFPLAKAALKKSPFAARESRNGVKPSFPYGSPMYSLEKLSMMMMTTLNGLNAVPREYFFIGDSLGSRVLSS